MNSFTAYADAFFSCGAPEVILPVIDRQDDTVTLTFPVSLFSGRHIDRLRVYSSWTERNAPADGYLFYPADFHFGAARTNFNSRPDTSHQSRVDCMSFAGIGGCENGVMVQILNGHADGRFYVEVRQNHYQLCPEFLLDGNEPAENLVIRYTAMPNGTYADAARLYRRYQLEVGGCKTLRERAAERPAVRYALESPELRIRMGWKPTPTPEMHQNDENEPPLHVACDIHKLRVLIREMKRQGIKQAEICLVGWGQGGHDGRFPQQVPSDPSYGTAEELKELIFEAQKLGYQMVCHTGSMEAYEVANNFDLNKMAHRKCADGAIRPMINEGYARSGGLSGGVPYIICPKTAYDPYGITDLPKVRDYGFAGLHFIDELTAVATWTCAHPDHPCTRQEAEDAYRKLAQFSTKLFGGFQSEGWIDYMNADVDYIMYTSFCNELNRSMHPLFDEMIPLWQLAWHGIVLSNPNSHTVNYPLKGAAQHLRFIEYGGRPLMYLYSKFGDQKNWMGDIDLRCETEADAPECVAAIKAAWDEYLPLRDLQYEFMDNHEKLADGVYRTTYSDGTQITVDYFRHNYTVHTHDREWTVSV